MRTPGASGRLLVSGNSALRESEQQSYWHDEDAEELSDACYDEPDIHP